MDGIGGHLIRFDIVTPNVCQHVPWTVINFSNGDSYVRERRLETQRCQNVGQQIVWFEKDKRLFDPTMKESS